jgi:hypothetical protein
MLFNICTVRFEVLYGGSYECQHVLRFRTSHLLHADFLLGWFSTLKTEVIISSETSIHKRTTRLYIPEDDNISNVTLYCSMIWRYNRCISIAFVPTPRTVAEITAVIFYVYCRYLTVTKRNTERGKKPSISNTRAKNIKNTNTVTKALILTQNFLV